MVSPLPYLRPGPNSTREPSSLAPRTFSTSLLVIPSSCLRRGSSAWLFFGIDVGGILFTWPIHLYLLFFTSKRDGQHPSSVVELRIGYLVWPKMCRILPRHLFWNTSSMWHIPLVTFQDSAAYSSTLSTLLLKMRIFVFLLIIFIFQMFFRAANAPLALLILVLISASVFPSFVTLAPRYVNSVTSSMSCSPSLTGSTV